jgi:uncharacterized protein (UPF0147 family)
MERFGVDATRAFGMLAAISQDTNTPVRDLAVRLVDSAKAMTTRQHAPHP